MALLIEGYFEKIPQSRKDSQEFKNQFESCESFLILKKAYFQKTTGIAFTTLTTDGSYIYLLVSALNGGLFKIGTGKNDTVAGKIYLERKSRLAVGQKPEEVSWVYLKGKLYVKRSSKDSWLLDVIDPDTFQHTSSVQLICPSLFGLQSLVNINKSSPLLTDGNSLFYLGNRIKITKACE